MRNGRCCVELVYGQQQVVFDIGALEGDNFTISFGNIT